MDDPFGDTQVITAVSENQVSVVRAPSTSPRPLRPKVLQPSAPTVAPPLLVLGCQGSTSGYLMARWDSGVINLYDDLDVAPSSSHLTAIDHRGSCFFVLENNAGRVKKFEYHASTGTQVPVDLPTVCTHCQLLMCSPLMQPAVAIAVDAASGHLWVVCPAQDQQKAFTHISSRQSGPEHVAGLRNRLRPSESGSGGHLPSAESCERHYL